ncbi:hypothetical protein FJU08_09580 [Martelella alba]|uniref:Uncharacterized protein n=1 Tax=Martelella alba TaxID=2590451 RepID=A0A506UE11_9HYPH|nr:hypothetical protein [Martelella alba]TPW30909.1 hypothetical protein FJU08_09580 [Martelella alba]
MKRQIDKIDTAIAEVESEFAEAIGEDEVIDAPDDAPPPVAEMPVPAPAPAPPKAPPAPEQYAPAPPVQRIEPEAQPEPVEQWQEPPPSRTPERSWPAQHRDVWEEPAAAPEQEEPSPEPEDQGEDYDFDGRRSVPAPPPSPEPVEEEDIFGQGHHARSMSEPLARAPLTPSQDEGWGGTDESDAPSDDDGWQPETPQRHASQPKSASRNDAEDDSFDSAYMAGSIPLAPPPPARPASNAEWDHVDTILGLAPGGTHPDFDDLDDEDDDTPWHDDDEPGRSKSILRRMLLPVIALVVVIALGIGGYFGWMHRDQLQSLVASGEGTPATETAAPAASSPATSDDTPTVAASEGGTIDKPYTQRLLPDGNEVDEGLPAEGSGSGTTQSVAAQTTPSASAVPEGTDTSTTPAPPVGSAQKMYLYEEQLGQSVPSAFQGTVEWNLKQQNNNTSVPEPVIEGKMSVPDAKLSGTITIRRNDDPSLPASHLIDISFDLGDGFDGGAIDNLQRISLKETEAARGDPLVAVSAKITDNLYMVALNDFDQARNQNLTLLQDRNWIDIPVTYRNGRRALLTLEKGTTGEAIFDRAIQEWQALGDITSGSN